MLDRNRSKTDKRSDFKMLKEIIIAAEKFAFETEKIDNMDLKKIYSQICILILVQYILWLSKIVVP